MSAEFFILAGAVVLVVILAGSVLSHVLEALREIPRAIELLRLSIVRTSAKPCSGPGDEKHIWIAKRTETWGPNTGPILMVICEKCREPL